MPCSLANVLRLRRPFVVVDEAHNSRTELAFDMLARFRPSGVMELTATPDLERTPSNVLHSVSAAEFKAEEMIKLPVVLETEPNWQQCLADAIGRRDALHKLADEERRDWRALPAPAGADSVGAASRGCRDAGLRARAQRADHQPRHSGQRDRRRHRRRKGAGADRRRLQTGHRRPGLPGQVRHHPEGAGRGLGLPVRLHPGQHGLAAFGHGGRAVARARVAATRREASAGRALNQSYAFVVSRNFAETAGALRDRLVAGAGFERREVTEFVTAAKTEQARLDLEGHAGRVVVRPVAITLPEKPDLKSVPKPVRDKVSWDGKLNTLTISTPLTEDEAEVLKASVTTETAAAAIVEAAEVSRTTAIEFFQTPAELGERFRVPQLARCASRASCACSTTRRCWTTRGTCRPMMPRPPPTTWPRWAPA